MTFARNNILWFLYLYGVCKSTFHLLTFLSNLFRVSANISLYLEWYVFRKIWAYLESKVINRARARRNSWQGLEKKTKKQKRVMYDLSLLYTDLASSCWVSSSSSSPLLLSIIYNFFFPLHPLLQLLLPTFEVTSRPFRPSVYLSA